jgi:hypothetical protein
VAAVAVLEDLQEVVASGGIERLEAPVVEDEQIDAAKATDQATAGRRHPMIEKEENRPRPQDEERTARTLYVEALDALLKGRTAEVAVARDWDLLEEVARLASEDAPKDLAHTDPSLFRAWREAVTKYHLKGWTNMTPERVRQVHERDVERKRAKTAETGELGAILRR